MSERVYVVKAGSYRSNHTLTFGTFSDRDKALDKIKEHFDIDSVKVTIDYTDEDGSYHREERVEGKKKGAGVPWWLSIITITLDKCNFD